MLDHKPEARTAQTFEETQAQEALQAQAVESVSAPARAIRYASDVEVDQAMQGIFRRHDRLFAELAK